MHLLVDMFQSILQPTNGIAATIYNSDKITNPFPVTNKQFKNQWLESARSFFFERLTSLLFLLLICDKTIAHHVWSPQITL